jgi:hypothetical protein
MKNRRYVMSKQSLGKWMAIGLGLAAAVAMPLGASAHGWGHGGYHHSYYRGGYHGHYYHGGHWSGGRWIAGAIVTGAVAGLVSDALSPPVVYAPPPVVYGPPQTVVYESAPVTRRVVTTRTVVYDDAPPTRYIRDDGYDGD